MTVYANRLREFQTLRIMRFGHSSGHYEDVYRSIGSLNIICLQIFTFVWDKDAVTVAILSQLSLDLCGTRNVHLLIAAIRHIIGGFAFFFNVLKYHLKHFLFRRDITRFPGSKLIVFFEEKYLSIFIFDLHV